MRVLVVDDNRDAARSTALLVGMNGHVAEAAYSGDEALEVARFFEPQVVLLDLAMPRMSGFETSRRLRKLPGFSEIPVIALTGFGDERYQEEAERYGFTSFLVKPVEFAALQDALLKVFGVAH
ncbi:MAG TPA: response regulator [Planctomycetaceae bacterium]|nr:response regulator [Planctomycetaceae bacterium]